MGLFDFFKSDKINADERFSSERQDRIDRILENISFGDVHKFIEETGYGHINLSVGKTNKLIKECVKYYVLFDDRDEYNIPFNSKNLLQSERFRLNHIYINRDNNNAFISMSTNSANHEEFMYSETGLDAFSITRPAYQSQSKSFLIHEYLHQIKMFEWITGYDPIKEEETLEEKLLVNNENELKEFVKKFK